MIVQQQFGTGVRSIDICSFRKIDPLNTNKVVPLLGYDARCGWSETGPEEIDSINLALQQA